MSSKPHRLTVAIDARIRHGQTGGVESVITGLAAALSRLDGPERYVFLTIRGEDDWLLRHLGESAEARPTGDLMGAAVERIRPWVERRVPGTAAIARRALRHKGPPESDGTVESIGADVVHLVHQWGFLTHIPSIYHPHDLQHRHLPELFDRSQILARDRWYTALAERAAVVAVASSWTRDDVIRQFDISSDRVLVIPWAPPIVETNAQGARPASPPLPPLPERFVLYPAQTWPHKNHAGLVRALALLRDTGTVINVVFTGRRNQGAPAIDRLIEELGVQDQVTWTGFIEEAQLVKIYRSATAVVIPSRFEAASGPLWEAFSIGIPVACSNATSLPLQAGDAALVFDPDQPHEIAAAMRRLWDDNALRRQLSERGKRQVAPFTWDRTARTFRALYRMLGRSQLDHEDRELLAMPPGI